MEKAVCMDVNVLMQGFFGVPGNKDPGWVPGPAVFFTYRQGKKAVEKHSIEKQVKFSMGELVRDGEQGKNIKADIT